MEQLHGWKSELPADLHIWYTDGLESSCLSLGSLVGASPADHNHSTEHSEPKLTACDSDSYLTYSEAALAALPEDDEARYLAQLASERGTTLQEVVSFCHRASHCTDPDCPPVTASEVNDDGDVTEARHYPLKNWRQAKKLKQMRKQKQRTAWLYM